MMGLHWLLLDSARLRELNLSSAQAAELRNQIGAKEPTMAVLAAVVPALFIKDPGFPTVPAAELRPCYSVLFCETETTVDLGGLAELTARHLARRTVMNSRARGLNTITLTVKGGQGTRVRRPSDDRITRMPQNVIDAFGGLRRVAVGDGQGPGACRATLVCEDAVHVFASAPVRELASDSALERMAQLTDADGYTLKADATGIN